MSSNDQGNGNGNGDSRGVIRVREGERAWARREAKRESKRKPHRDVTKDIAFVEQVALATYFHDDRVSHRSPRAVAKELNTSVPAVSAALERAYELGIVFPQLSIPKERAQVLRLERKVKQRYPKLREVLLVPGFPSMLDKPTREHRQTVHMQVVRAMARRVADYLDEFVAKYVGNANGVLIGCAWGRTVHAVAEFLNMTPRAVQLPLLRAMPIVGVTLATHEHPVEANVVASHIATAFGGSSGQLPSPAILDAMSADFVLKSPEIRRILRDIEACELVLTGMGPILHDPDGDSEIRLVNDPETNQKLIEAARARGAIGEMCSWFFNEAGEPVETRYTTVGLGYAGLKRIAADPKRRVVLVTGGDVKRFRPLKVALKAGLASTLVTDTVTARYLVDELR